MPEHVPLRHLWEGPPVRISSGWTLTKGRHRAECELFAHQLGWELRLFIDGELRMSQLCLAQDDILDVQERWKSEMLHKGWSADGED